MLLTVGNITVLTRRQRLTLDHAEATALLKHIHEHRADAEGPLIDAINAQGATEVRWSVDEKRGVLGAIVRWLVVGDSDAPESVRELEAELMCDLSAPDE